MLVVWLASHKRHVLFANTRLSRRRDTDGQDGLDPRVSNATRRHVNIEIPQGIYDHDGLGHEYDFSVCLLGGFTDPSSVSTSFSIFS